MSEITDWHEEVLAFWFKELGKQDWFVKNEAVDKAISSRFEPLYEQLGKEDVARHVDNGPHALAAVIVLDQFPRNMYRGTAKAFATDAAALALTRAAIAAQLDKDLSNTQKQFLYMPLMHAEEELAQEQCVALFSTFNDEHLLSFALGHKKIIDRFGRFPHRNDSLGRSSTAPEIKFLNEPGSSY